MSDDVSDDEFQEIWDRELLNRFYSSPDMLMWMFEVRIGGRRPKKRGIKEEWQNNLTVCRFVCEAMPKLGNIMWNVGKDNVHKVVAALKNSPLDSSGNVSLKTALESGEKKNMKRVYRQGLAKTAISLDMRDAFTAWGTVKQTGASSRVRAIRRK